MKRLNFIKVFLVVNALLQLSACKKYLDKKPDNSLVVPTTLMDLQALLDNSTVMNLQTPNSGDASSDDYFLLEDDYNSLGDAEKSTYIWQPYDKYYDNDWAYCYQAVYYSNLVLEGVNDIPMTASNSAQWKNIKGSALFYRAFSFLNLSWIYAKPYDENSSINDLGIVLRMSSNFNIPSVRASVRQSYDQIIKDIKDAIPYLPALSIHVFRPSKAAAYGLLARTYLSMKKYDNAALYADSCLQIQNIILNYNDPTVSPNNSIPFKINNPEIIFYAEENQTVPANYTYYNAIIDTLLYSSFDNNDLRKEVFFDMSIGFPQFKGSYAAKDYTFFTGLATDEVYLIRAEANARIGNKDASLSDLNFLLSKRWKNNGTWTPIGASDALEAINIIISERRKELLMRGIRWSDLKRLNSDGYNIGLTRIIGIQTYTLQANSNHYAFPIPSDIINISGIQQNPY